MKAPRFSWKSIVLAIGLAVAILAVVVGLANEQTRSRQRLEIPREWARLAPYPDSARNLRATTSGGMFTRTFEVRFQAPAADVERWLRASPGPREAMPDHPSPGKRRYVIAPGGGANHVEVTVDDTLGEVSIYAEWS